MNTRRIYLFILLNVIIVSTVLSLQMVEGSKKDKQSDNLYEQYGEYGFFACYDTDTNTTTYYDQRVSENCVMIGDGN